MVVGGGGYYAAKDVNFKMTMGIINTKYSVVRACEPTSFGRENVTAIVILSRRGGNK